VQNRISKINGLETLGANLRSLELGSNRIRVREPVFTVDYLLMDLDDRELGCISQSRGAVAWEEQDY
jgi:hypothetical protein